MHRTLYDGTSILEGVPRGVKRTPLPPRHHRPGMKRRNGVSLPPPQTKPRPGSTGPEQLADESFERTLAEISAPSGSNIETLDNGNPEEKKTTSRKKTRFGFAKKKEDGTKVDLTQNDSSEDKKNTNDKKNTDKIIKIPQRRRAKLFN
ncbi:hypothetical protein Hamer_G026353 [Homarus americanus]|uniref:Uncharacterized protein n=1 Tax=Homarus americanus TaxID=6706 RepID=A0A8J5JGL3_HOMAM|nr:hypothetical protein Hamer_G026353 [Homarus americanus]